MNFLIGGRSQGKTMEIIEQLAKKNKELREENLYLKLNNPEQNIEHLRIVKENKRKIDNLRKQIRELKRNCNIGNENLSFYIQENNQLKEELKKADSLTQSCIFEGVEVSQLNFRKAINIIKELRSWLEKEKSTFGSYRYEEVLNKLNELEGKNE